MRALRHHLVLVMASLFAVIAFLPGGVSAAEGPTRFNLSPDAFAAYQRWVLAMCIGGDEQALALDLGHFAAELVPAFQRAISEGPTQLEIQQVRDAAAMLYERRAKLPLSEMEVTGVTRADLARFQRQSRAAFVEDQVKRFTTGYRANAIAALGMIVAFGLYLFVLAGVGRVIRNQTGIVLNPFAWDPVLLWAPAALVALGALAGLVPAWRAYRTDVASNLAPES